MNGFTKNHLVCTFAATSLVLLGVVVDSSIHKPVSATPLFDGLSTPQLKDSDDLESPEILDAGLVVIASPYEVDETGDRFEVLLQERGATVFARIDHTAGAESIDLELRPTQVIIFGNPRVGTPLMQCGQSMAIDLPQKLLIWENESGDVYIGYNAPRYLADRHGILGCEEAIARVEEVLMGLTNALIDEE